MIYYQIAKRIVRLGVKICFNIHWEGLENIPSDTTLIFTSNHRSNADPPIVGCALKGEHVFMAKEELFKNKFFGALIKSLGAFPVARGKGDTAVLDTAVEKLDSGKSLIIFPEGTRSRDGKVHRGHSGAAVIAVRSGKPIIPVGITFSGKLHFRSKITVRYGKPIYPADFCTDFENPNPRELVKLKKKYMEEIKALVDEPEEVPENPDKKTEEENS